MLDWLRQRRKRLRRIRRSGIGPHPALVELLDNPPPDRDQTVTQSGKTKRLRRRKSHRLERQQERWSDSAEADGQIEPRESPDAALSDATDPPVMVRKRSAVRVAQSRPSGGRGRRRKTRHNRKQLPEATVRTPADAQARKKIRKRRSKSLKAPRHAAVATEVALQADGAAEAPQIAAVTAPRAQPSTKQRLLALVRPAALILALLLPLALVVVDVVMTSYCRPPTAFELARARYDWHGTWALSLVVSGGVMLWLQARISEIWLIRAGYLTLAFWKLTVLVHDRIAMPHCLGEPLIAEMVRHRMEPGLILLSVVAYLSFAATLVITLKSRRRI